MFQKRTYRWMLPSVAAFLITVGCGGSTHTDTLSAAQAQAISQQVVQAAAQAVANAIHLPLPALEQPPVRMSEAIGGIHPDQSLSCMSNPTGETCDFPISASGPCSKGGTISVTGDIQGTLNNSGSGSLAAQVTITPANCAVSNITFNGDPNISIAGQINFTNMGPTFPITLMEGGGITYGPNPSGTCQLNVTYSINSVSSCMATGTVCGQPVSGKC
jgi:hypothetical protein